MSGLVPLPAQPEGLLWPTDTWPTGELPPGVELQPIIDQAFDPENPIAPTFAVLVVHRGRIVAERYEGQVEHFDRAPTRVWQQTPLVSWSMAKSVLHAVIGLLVGEGRLDLDAPAAVPEWSGPDDPRDAITLRQLLAMRDGLDYAEDYTDEKNSDVIEMLFGSGQGDVAHFAADRPLAAEPGTRFNYSSGTSNIVSGIVARTVGPGEAYAKFLYEHLFSVLGMRSADPKMDEAGTWVASSSLYATARDYARFGLLYLRDGMWDGVRVLPEGWVDYGRTMVSADQEDGTPYGAHWWGVPGDTLDHLNPLGTFRASGYEGQTITICPALDLILVRLGKTPYEREEVLPPWRAAMVRAFETPR